MTQVPQNLTKEPNITTKEDPTDQLQKPLKNALQTTEPA
jgi:hypothetical protein